MTMERSGHQMGAAEDQPSVLHFVHVVETITYTYVVSRPLTEDPSGPSEIDIVRNEAARRHREKLSPDELRYNVRKPRWAFVSLPRKGGV